MNQKSYKGELEMRENKKQIIKEEERNNSK